MDITYRTQGSLLIVSALVLGPGCGDDTRASASAGQTEASASATATGTSTGTGTVSATITDTVTPTTTDGGVSNSVSQGDTSTTDVPTTSISATDTSSTGEPITSAGSSTGSTTLPVDPCAGEMGGFDFSYLWVANTSQGSVSKINTLYAANCGVYGRVQAVG